MKLIICEKQAAAKRIASILGRKVVANKIYGVPYYEFNNHFVIGLSGHVLRVDFPKKYSSWSTDLKKLVNAELVYLKDKVNIIKAVKELIFKSDDLIIATDYDTEGESIGFEIVRLFNKPVKRMIFSSLINDEIIKAYNNLSTLNVNLANSADARREIDLIWGAVLTRFLSVSTKRLGKYYLSAGRVQSPTLTLIVNKELERLAFKPEPYWEVALDFGDFKAVHQRITDERIVKDFNNKGKAIIINVKKQVKAVEPPAPLNTTSFLTSAASLGYSGINAMRIAESLYLKGLISYPRTDNTVYPKELDLKKIIKQLGLTKYDKYLRKDYKPTKGRKETKDHPPIYPTGVKPTDLTTSELRLYELIVKRFIATLSINSEEEVTKIKLSYNNHEFTATGYKIIELGWRGVYDYSLKEEVILPELNNGDELTVKEVIINKKLTQPPNRYGHGTIIKKMNELNLGTKSTRPSIIQKLFDRYYVFYSKSLEPTPIAMAVIKALINYAEIITSHEMTSNLEREMDLIAEGKLTKSGVVNDSRKILLKIIKTLEANKDLIAKKIREGIRDSKIVGKCPKCGNDLIIINARNRFIGCKGYPDCRNAYPLPAHGMIQVTNNVCKFCGLKKIALLGKKQFVFCPNIDCPSRDDDEETLKLRKKRDDYLKSLQ